MAYNAKDITKLQQSIAPEVYENVDLSIIPERFRTELGANSILRKNKRVQDFLADKEKVEFFRQLTLMGDPIADAYAALFPKLGFQRARGMLDEAIEKGIDQVEDAPQELIDFMKDMETAPEWLDWEKIDEGAESLRLFWALFGDVMIRVGFMLTYVNGYQGLPMVMTGALSSESAAKRMKETISTFKLSVLPNALRRNGKAFESAAKVRVMHAMVRTSLLRKPDHWDYNVYGTPIPQVDQMGAALNGSYNLALLALGRKGKSRGKFGKRSQNVVELNRYLTYLLGMHDQFLSDDPKQIVETWQACQATLRHQYDERGRALNDATMSAYRRHGNSVWDKLYHDLETRSTKVLYKYLVGRKTAKDMGIEPNAADFSAFGVLMTPIFAKFALFTAMRKTAKGRQWVDRYCIRQIEKQLEMNGEAEYKTDEKNYNFAKNS